MLATSQTIQPPTLGRRKPLPQVTTMLIDGGHPQLRRPTPIETVIYNVSAEASQDTVMSSKRQSRNILALFSRNKSSKDGTKEEMVAGRSSMQVVGNSVQDKSKRMSYLRKSEQSRLPEAQAGPLPFSEAMQKARKHITLAVPSMDADGLLKLQKLRKDGQSTAFNESDLHLDAKIQESRRRSSTTIPNDGMTSTFVLSSRGLLAQYTATGKPERLPERHIQLNSGSAAFASDAIAGKHWVLQVVKSFVGDSTSAASTSRLSRIIIRSSKATTNNMLLVMENAEDMEDWLATLRQEISSQGSETYQLRKFVPKSNINTMQQIQERPSRRYLIEKSPLTHPRIQPSCQSSDAATTIQHMSRTSLNRPAGRPEIPHPVGYHTASAVSKTHTQRREKNIPPASSEHKISSSTLLKWELPSNYSATFSPDLSTLHSIPSIQTRQPPEDSYPRSYRSTSATSDVAPNFSVPIFSHRFSQSTRSGTSIMTPPRSSGSSHRTSSPVQPTKDLLERRGAAALPHIATSVSNREVRETHEIQSNTFDQDWTDTEEPVPSRFHTTPNLPKRFSSLNMLDSVRATGAPEPSALVILTSTLGSIPNSESPAMVLTSNRASSLYPDSPRSTIASKRSSFIKPTNPSITLAPERATFQNVDDIRTKTNSLVPYPKVDAYELRRHLALGLSHQATFELIRKSSMASSSTNPTRSPPAIPETQGLSTSPRPTTTTTNTPRPYSFQPPGSPSFLQPETSLNSLTSHQYFKPMNVRERRSFGGRIPTHLLGPPAPPPMGPLPAIPRPKTSHVH